MSNRLQNWWQQWLITTDEAATRARLAVRARSEHMAADKPLQLSGLEPRILFSATPIDPAMMPGGDEAAMVVEVELEDASESDVATIDSVAEQTGGEIIFIDSAVPEIQQLLDDLSASRRDAEVFVLDADRDGLDQITEILDSRTDIDSIHLVSHAEDGAVKLGNVWLGDSNLAGYAGQIASWQSALTGDADILLYGCDLASDSGGQSLIESISVLTGADVAASDDDTGHSEFRGDWDLEYTIGAIETDVAFSTGLQQSWRGKLSVYTVETLDDVIDGGDSVMSLREAILLSNIGGGGDTIILGAGIYELRAGADDLAGDLDIRNNPVTIIGAGADATFIDAQFNDRVMEIHSGAGTVTITGVTLQNGSTTFAGGGLFVGSGVNVTIQDSEIRDNHSNATGGGIDNWGTLTLERVTVAGNDASDGGGICSKAGSTLVMTNATISGNTASSDGGGLFNQGISLLRNLTITDNTAGGVGGGIEDNTITTTDIANSIVYGNNSGSGGGDVSGGIESSGYNIIGHASGGGLHGTDDTSGDPMLDTLGYYGGTTRTHALLAGSAAIDPSLQLSPPAEDQRGMARDGSPDIGAFEFGANTTTTSGVDTTVTSTDSTIEDNDLVFSVADANAITVDDGTTNDPVLRTTLTVTGGVLNLATTTGLTSVTGDGTNTVIVIGAESAINASLDGLTYSPTGDYNGAANLQVTTNLQADLLGYYTFSQTNPLGDDSSPVGANDGTPSVPGAPLDPHAIFDGDRNSDVLVLDGVDDNIQIAGRFSTPSDVTVAAWVNVAAVNNQDVISIGGSFGLRLNDVNNGDGITGFYHDGSGWNHTDSAQFVGGDGWHHVAFTFDDANNTQVIYIDGAALGTTSYSGAINWAHQPNTTLGSHANSSSYFLNGMIDDARIYDRALSAGEIQALATDQFSDTEVISITVDPDNDAPTLLDDLPTLTDIDEDDFTSAGDSVAAIIVDGSITDQDGSAVESIAITAVDNSNGTWQYSTNNGGSWLNVDDGMLTDDHALLLDGTLTGASTQKLRFVPTGGFDGDAAFTFRARDQSAGTAGTYTDTTPPGGTSAFSNATDTASITVNAVATDITGAKRSIATWTVRLTTSKSPPARI